MNWNCTKVLGLMGAAIAGVLPSARANVNLDFRPDTQTVAVGDVVNIDVYAVSDSLVDQGFLPEISFLVGILPSLTPLATPTLAPATLGATAVFYSRP